MLSQNNGLRGGEMSEKKHRGGESVELTKGYVQLLAEATAEIMTYPIE